MLTPELLDTMERESALAPATVLRLHAQTIRASLADAPDDLCAQGIALLMKLEHLERCDVVAPAMSEEYLAPHLLLMEPLAAMAPMAVAA